MGPIKGCPRGCYDTKALKPPDKVFCFFCNKSYKRRPILEHHIKTKHFKYRVSCPMCSKKLTSTSVLRRHMANVHAIRSYTKMNVTFSPSLELFQPCYEESNSGVLPYMNMSFERDTAFPSIANVLMSKENELFGVHMVAKCDIDVGKVVIVSNAFASIECVSSVDSCCFQCGRPQNNEFLRCPHCIDTFFCSKKCSLSKTHLSKCNKIFNSNDSYIIRLATEIIKNAFEMAENTDIFIEFVKGVLFRKIKYKECQPPYSFYGEILSLKGLSENDHSIMAHRVVQCSLDLPKISCSKKTDLKRVLFSMACRHIAAIKINSYSEDIPVSKGVCTRFAIHDVLSRVNHSCTPNIHHYYDRDNIIRCVTIRPIKKGDQLYMNYLGELQFDDELSRKCYIQKHWLFNCKCDLCCHNTHASQPDPSYDYIKLNFKKNKAKNSQHICNLAQECQTYLNKFGHLWSDAISFVVSCFIFVIHNMLLSI